MGQDVDVDVDVHTLTHTSDAAGVALSSSLWLYVR